MGTGERLVAEQPKHLMITAERLIGQAEGARDRGSIRSDRAGSPRGCSSANEQPEDHAERQVIEDDPENQPKQHAATCRESRSHFASSKLTIPANPT